MIRLHVFTLLFLLIALDVKAQCNEYYVLNKGSEWEYHTLNAKGKLTGKNLQKVTDLTQTGSGYAATVNSQMLDAKGKEITKADVEIKCEGGTVHIDMRNFVSQEQLKAFGDYEMKVEGTNLEIPSKLSAGQSLGDGTITITAVGTPMPMKMTVTISNRKVEGQESVTTPAGTFDCYKITSDMTMENQFGMKMTMKGKSIEWIAPKVATVKSESYDKSGKLVGSMVLAQRTN